jgi:hypothetical protein
MPIAAKMPRSAMGGSGVARLARKPPTVAAVASSSAIPTVRTAVEAATTGASPRPCCSR